MVDIIPTFSQNLDLKRVEDGDSVWVCGVNDCSREVDSSDATCWQHQPED